MMLAHPLLDQAEAPLAQPSPDYVVHVDVLHCRVNCGGSIFLVFVIAVA